MKIIEHPQGSAAWHDHRAKHFNASDAPAMMGCSPYKTRSQLLHEMHSGIAAEVDASQQYRFNEGHRFEALCRPLAAQTIGEALFPVVGSLGQYSASFDGLTMDESIAFEHKTLNDELRAAMNTADGSALPLAYRVQMEQQCMVSGAEKVLFMATKWQGDELVERREAWYLPDAALRQKIEGGWAQFAQDLAAYKPAETVAEAVGRTPESLPALRIEVTGEVTDSNLEQYRTHALAVFAGINRDLQTDQDFANAAKAVAWCSDVESRLRASKEHALSQTESIDRLFKTIDAITAEARATRLELDKLVEARKQARKGEIVAGAVKALADHVEALNARIGRPYMPATSADFGGAIKGLKTFASMQNAVDTALANAKIAASAAADRTQHNMGLLRVHTATMEFLFPDILQIVHKDADDLLALVKTRIADHREKEESRIHAERERIYEEERAKAQAAVKAEENATTSAPAAVRTNEEATPTELPGLSLGSIANRLGFALPADFLRGIGFEPAGRQRAAVLYHQQDFPRICDALIAHIQKIKPK